MICAHKVLQELRMMSGLEDTQAAQYLPLCAHAAAQVESRLREGGHDQDPAVIHAAAGIAFYRVALREAAASDVESFAAGDVRVERKSGDRLKIAQRIRDEAISEAAPLLSDTAFLFRSI